MKLLAIDTSTEACSAALYIDGSVTSREQIAPQQHSELILPMCEALLAEAGLHIDDVGALAYGRGPGSFTGVRIATGVIQGIGFALELPVVPVSSLAALAQGALRDCNAEAVIAAIDARMDEVYWGAFRAEDGVMLAVTEECICPPEAAPMPPGDDWYGAGTGWGAYGVPLKNRMGGRVREYAGERFPLARDVAVLAVDAYRHGHAAAAEQALPVYLRDNVVRKPQSV